MNDNSLLFLLWGLVFTCIGMGIFIEQFVELSFSGLLFLGLGFVLMIIGVIVKDIG